MRNNHQIVFLLISLFALLSTNCYSQSAAIKKDSSAQNQLYLNRPTSLGIMGDTTDVVTAVKPGVVLMGGGKDVEAAFEWMISRSGGGNVVIIRASGTNAYNSFVYKTGKVSSVETLKIDTRERANDDEVARIIRNAEMLFIAGGNQSVYIKEWRSTKTSEAINYLVNIKKVPEGGTSAGCAILGQLYYSGENESAVSKDVLTDPYHSSITLYKDDFLKIPYLKEVITDQHYITRSRQGRHIVFMSRIIKDWRVFPKGIAADERTAVCIDESGIAKVFGSSKAFFIASDRKKIPEVCEKGKPLNWVAKKKALKVYEIKGTMEGNGSFNVSNFNYSEAKGGKELWWWVENGELKSSGEDKE